MSGFKQKICYCDFFFIWVAAGFVVFTTLTLSFLTGKQMNKLLFESSVNILPVNQISEKQKDEQIKLSSNCLPEASSSRICVLQFALQCFCSYSRVAFLP